MKEEILLKYRLIDKKEIKIFGTSFVTNNKILELIMVIIK